MRVCSARRVSHDPELERVRTGAGLFSLGIGVIGLPVALALYAVAAALAVAFSTACVGAQNWLCAPGPLLLAPIAAAFALAALLGVVVSLASVLFAGAALVRPRWLYIGATGLVGALSCGIGGAFVAHLALTERVTSVESVLLGPRLTEIAWAAPLVAVGLACVLAAATRATMLLAREALERRDARAAAARRPGSGSADASGVR